LPILSFSIELLLTCRGVQLVIERRSKPLRSRSQHCCALYLLYD
jgi:hypothetical protein